MRQLLGLAMVLGVLLPLAGQATTTTTTTLPCCNFAVGPCCNCNNFCPSTTTTTTTSSTSSSTTTSSSTSTSSTTSTSTSSTSTTSTSTSTTTTTSMTSSTTSTSTSSTTTTSTSTTVVTTTSTSSSTTTSTTLAGGTCARGIGNASGYDNVTGGVVADSSGNIYVAGVFSGPTVTIGSTILTNLGGMNGTNDFFLVKYTSACAVVWVRGYGSTMDDQVLSLAVDAAGNPILSGSVGGVADFGGGPLPFLGTGSNMVIAKINASGAHVWSRTYGSTVTTIGANANAVATDSSNNVYVSGWIGGVTTFGATTLTPTYISVPNLFLLKLDSAGTVVFAKNFTTASDGSQKGLGLAVDTTTSNVALVGEFTNTINLGGSNLVSGSGLRDGFVAHFTSAGVHRWSLRFGGTTTNDAALATAVNSVTGAVFVTGYVIGTAVDLGCGSTGVALGAEDVILGSFSGTTGACLWSTRYGSTSVDIGNGVAVDGAASAVYLAAQSSGTINLGAGATASFGSSDAYLARYATATGANVWVKHWGGTQANVPNRVSVTSAGNPLVGGYTFGTGTFDGTSLVSTGLSDGFWVKTSP